VHCFPRRATLDRYPQESRHARKIRHPGSSSEAQWFSVAAARDAILGAVAPVQGREAVAGSAFSGVVGPGQAVRVMTGAVLPRGTDTVVIQEIVRRQDNDIEIPTSRFPRANAPARTRAAPARIFRVVRSHSPAASGSPLRKWDC
jgi:hypothetical protein